MRRGWSLRRLVTVSLLVSFALAVPFAAVVFHRLSQLHEMAPHGTLDLAIRDAASYFAIWVVLAAALLVWARRRVVQPIRRLERIMVRVSDGDLGVEVPLDEGGELGRLAAVLRQAVERLEQREERLRDKIGEMRELVRRLLEVASQPVLVVSMSHTVDYVNEAAATALAVDANDVHGVRLETLPGGAALGTLVDSMRREGQVRLEAVLEESGLDRKHVADCVVVRDSRGEPRRVLIVLRTAGRGWWRQLWAD